MKKLTELINNISRLFDRIAGWGIVALMVMVVTNVLMRVVFNSPLLGVYEYVGYFAAVIIGLSLAFCYVQDAHISISFITDKLSPRLRHIVGLITQAVAVVFMALFSYQMVDYAIKTAASGEVSATTRILTYPFILIIAAGLIILTLVILVQFINNIRTVANK
jgi:TRAP-type C4-dicarboxylate transport system permease small subunit